MKTNYNMEIKFFDLHKNTRKEKDTHPDYNLSFKSEDSFVNGGACWKKQDKNGNTYLSCKFGEAYQDRKGYHIAEDGSTKHATDPLNEL